MKDHWYKGKSGAPAGVIPDIGLSGPGVLLLARDAAHAGAIERVGYFEKTDPPQEAEAPAGAPDADALTTQDPAAPKDRDAAPSKKGGK